MDWVPIVFIIFKALVFGTGMFLAIKWHYDQKKKGKPTEKREVWRVVGKVALVIVIFGILLAGLLFFTFALGRKLGLDLS
jgi:sterol desaturase/sphingolipid hydroxylase (fatty acid hydroxylase superfamily)